MLNTLSLLAQRTALQKDAASLVGTEMIFTLCDNAAQYITERHSDVASGKQTSLEDQRRQRGQEEKKASAYMHRHH